MEFKINAEPKEIVDLILAMQNRANQTINRAFTIPNNTDSEHVSENVFEERCNCDCNHMSIGENLRKLREKAGLSQNELARRANVTPAAINMIEKGTRNLALATGKDIADVLGCSLYDFFDGSNREAV